MLVSEVDSQVKINTDFFYENLIVCWSGFIYDIIKVVPTKCKILSK